MYCVRVNTSIVDEGALVKTCLVRAMSGEDRPLVTYEPIEFRKVQIVLEESREYTLTSTNAVSHPPFLALVATQA